MPIYERIARAAFKDKPPVPFKIPPGLRMVRTTYEGGAIDEVFKPGTEPGGESFIGQLENIGAPGAGDVTTGNVGAGTLNGPAGAPGSNPRRGNLSGTGETY